MRILLSLSLLFAASTSLQAQDLEFEARTWSYQSAIATAESLQEIEPLLIVLDQRPDLIGKSALDFLAEVAHAGLPNGNHDRVIRRKIIKALADRAIPRYYTLLKTISQETEWTQARDDARMAASGKAPPDSVEQYQPGSINLVAFREKLIADALAFQPSDALAKKLATLKSRSSLETLFALMGRPQAVESGARFWPRGAQAPTMNLVYRGIGRVFFHYHRKIGWYSHHITIDPIAYEQFMPYRARAAELGMPDDTTLRRMQLLSLDPVAFQVAASNLENWEGRPPRELLDLAAERLLRDSLQPLKRPHLLALVSICRTMRLKGGPGYEEVLKKAHDTATHEDVRDSCVVLPTKKQYDNVIPFEFGKIDIDAIRATLPPAYPERKELRNQ
jgi:hypothetical protein